MIENDKDYDCQCNTPDKGQWRKITLHLKDDISIAMSHVVQNGLNTSGCVSPCVTYVARKIVKLLAATQKELDDPHT